MSYYDDLYSESEPQQEQVQNPVETELEPDTYVSRQPQPKKKGAGKKLLAAIIVVALIAGGCVLTAVLVNNHWQEQMEIMNQRMDQKIQALQEQYGTPAIPSDGTMLQGSQLTPGQVYAKNVDAVVAVTGVVSYGYAEGYSSGTGFLISQDGYVVTNYHVIEGAQTLTVTLHNEEKYTAEVVGYESTNDLAVLKIEGADFPYVTIGKSADLRVGDQVVAIGNALGTLSSSLTVGYVSGVDRIVDTEGVVMNMVQTDVAINSGNSGGPLFNMQGEVVGITTAKFSGQTESGVGIEGLGFAIPMDDVVGMIEDIKLYGYVTGAYLGVYVLDVDTNAQYYGLPAGAYIDGTMEGLAAEKGGIKTGDIVVELGGYEVTSVSDLTRVLRKFKPGETVVVRVYRSGQYVQLRVTLDERPQETEEVPAQPSAPAQGEKDKFKEFYENFFG